jgi:hypothetical protein
MAVSQGFEPRVGYKPTLVFKTSALNRSANSPQLLSHRKRMHLTKIFMPVNDLLLKEFSVE